MLAKVKSNKKSKKADLNKINLNKAKTTNICVVCDKKYKSKIEKKLYPLDVKIHWKSFDEKINSVWLNKFSIKTTIFYQPKDSLVKLNYFLENKIIFSQPTIFMKDLIADSISTKLYKIGFDLVIDFKAESKHISLLIAQAIGFYSIKGKVTNADKTLARTVKAHLKLVRPIYSKLSVKSNSGIVSISGSVTDLWKISEIKEYIEGIPGVKYINTDSINVITEAVSDKQLRKSVLKIIQSQPFLDSRIISFDISRGHLILAGKTLNKESMKKFTNTLEHVPGIKSLMNNIQITSDGYKKEVLKANRLKKGLEVLFSDNKISVSVFGNNVCLRGKCKSLKNKQEIINYVSSQSGVNKIIDKIT